MARRRRHARCHAHEQRHAAIRYVTAAGDAEVALIEWKYTEQYIGKELQSGTNQATRDKRYRHLYEDPAGPVLTDVIPYEDFYVDPVYQLFRLALLAWRFELAGVASKVRVLYCTPGRNEELWESLNRASHRAVADNLLGFWPELQRRPDRFVFFDTAALVSADGTDQRRVQGALPSTAAGTPAERHPPCREGPRPARWFPPLPACRGDTAGSNPSSGEKSAFAFTRIIDPYTMGDTSK